MNTFLILVLIAATTCRSTCLAFSATVLLQAGVEVNLRSHCKLPVEMSTPFEMPHTVGTEYRLGDLLKCSDPRDPTMNSTLPFGMVCEPGWKTYNKTYPGTLGACYVANFYEWMKDLDKDAALNRAAPRGEGDLSEYALIPRGNLELLAHCVVARKLLMQKAGGTGELWKLNSPFSEDMLREIVSYKEKVAKRKQERIADKLNQHQGITLAVHVRTGDVVNHDPHTVEDLLNRGSRNGMRYWCYKRCCYVIPARVWKEDVKIPSAGVAELIMLSGTLHGPGKHNLQKSLQYLQAVEDILAEKVQATHQGQRFDKEKNVKRLYDTTLDGYRKFDADAGLQFASVDADAIVISQGGYAAILRGVAEVLGTPKEMIQQLPKPKIEGEVCRY